ncbi:MAG: cytoskeletal protein CcmA (bactofilin family), partial [Polyangiales bacterium]
LNFVSHLQTDPLISVRVEDVPLRAFLSVALAGESNVTVMRRDGMIVVLPSDQVVAEAPELPLAPEVPEAPEAPVVPLAPIAPVPPLPVGDVDDRVSMGGDLHVAQGETVSDLFTMGGDAVVDGVVLGDCVTMGGDVEIRGVVHGEVVSMGGDIHIFPGARVLGEVGTMGGEITNESGVFIQNDFDEVDDEEHPARDFFRRASRHGVIFLLGLILLGAFQSRHALLCQAVIRSPLRAAMSGAGGFFAALVMTIALAVTIIGIPISILVVLLTTVSVYFGFAIVASVLGALLPVPKWRGHPLKQLAAGVAILFALSSLPVVSVFADIVAACIGFGAVVLTRFGRGAQDPR